MNLYSYVRNNPLSNVDPDGLRCVWDDGSFDSEDDLDTAAVDKNGNHSNCRNQGGTWHDKGEYSPGVDWASANTDQTLTLHVNGGPFKPGYAGQQGGKPGAGHAAVDFIASGALGAVIDVLNINFISETPTYTGNNPRRFFSTFYCGKGGSGPKEGVINAACVRHDKCFDDAHLSADNNAPGGPAMREDQIAAAKACNQALYNVARSNPRRPGANALQWWLVNGSHPPFGAALIAPGTEAKPW